MAITASGFPLMEFIWYGIASLAFLLCFASLSYEVQCGLHACEKAQDQEAWRVTWTTYHVNFIVMIVAHLLFIFALIGTYVLQGDDGRLCLAAAIFVGGSYLTYTRACEKKLILFLKKIGIHPPSYSSGRLAKFWRK